MRFTEDWRWEKKVSIDLKQINRLSNMKKKKDWRETNSMSRAYGMIAKDIINIWLKFLKKKETENGWEKYLNK